jgi:hypothetical protein
MFGFFRSSVLPVWKFFTAKERRERKSLLGRTPDQFVVFLAVPIACCKSRVRSLSR